MALASNTVTLTFWNEALTTTAAEEILITGAASVVDDTSNGYLTINMAQ